MRTQQGFLRFSNGFVLSDLGGATRGGWYVFGLISNVVKGTKWDVRTTTAVLLMREEIPQAPVRDRMIIFRRLVICRITIGMVFGGARQYGQAYRRQQEAPHERNLLRVFLRLALSTGRAPAARNNTPLTLS